MRFLADMGVGLSVVTWLRSQGHDSTHLRDEGLHRLPNGAIFEKARREGRIVLTFDLDFGEVAALTEGKGSVVIFRLRNARAARVIARLTSVLEASSDALRDGAIVIVDDVRHRVRRLPIGS